MPFELTIKVGDLVTCLGHALKFTAKGDLDPLQGVMVAAEANTVKFSATDTVKGLKISCAAQIDEAGSAFVRPRDIRDLVSTFPADADVRLGASKESVRVQSGRADYDFALLPPDYPKLDLTMEGPSVTVDLSDIKAALNSVKYAACKPGTGPNAVFETVNLKISQDGITVSATDNARFARVIRPCEVSGDEVSANVLPQLHDVLKIMQGDQVTLSFTKSRVIVTDGASLGFVQLVEGRFPDGEAIIPKDIAGKDRIEREVLLSTLRRASVVASWTRERGLEIKAEPDGIKLAQKSAMGSCEEQVESAHEGDSLHACLDSGFLLSALASLDGQNVTMKYTGDFKPILLEAEDGNAIALIMPQKSLEAVA